MIRYDLEKCFRFNEYNEASAYGRQNIDIKGVKDQLQSLQEAKDAYIREIKGITAPEREEEAKRFLTWEKWSKAAKCCLWILLGVLGVSIANLFIGGFLPNFLSNMLYLLWLFVIPALLAFAVTKVGEWLCDKSYNHYVSKIRIKVLIQNSSFADTSKSCYNAIDNLYLRSLDSAHREMVLMRREQAEHNKEMLRLEQQRQEKETQRLEEERRTRKAQERLLEIEEERERRYKGYK